MCFLFDSEPRENGKVRTSYKTMKILNDCCKRYSIDVSIADTERKGEYNGITN